MPTNAGGGGGCAQAALPLSMVPVPLLREGEYERALLAPLADHSRAATWAAAACWEAGV